MKKTISLLTAASIALALTVPMSASAEKSADGAGAQIKLNYTFDAPFTSAEWTPTPAGGTADENTAKLNAAISGGKLALNSSDSKPSAIAKRGQKLYGDYTLSFDVGFGTAFDSLEVSLFVNDNDSTCDTINITANSGKTAGSVSLNGSTVLYDGISGKAYLLPQNTYCFTYTVSNSKGSLTVTPAEGSKFNTASKTFAKTTTDMAVQSGYNYTSGLRFKNNTNSAGVLLDNIKAVVDKSVFTADNITADGKFDPAVSGNVINITTTKYFPAANTANVFTMTKNGEEYTDFSVHWAESSVPAGYSVNPTITFNTTPTEGSYVLSAEIKDVYGYTSKPKWEFEIDKIPLGDPFDGFSESSLAVDKTAKTISGFINGYPSETLVPIWNSENASGVIKNSFGETVTAGGIYDGYTYAVTNADGEEFVYTFKSVTDIYANSFDTDVVLSDKSSEITSANTGQRDKMFTAEDAVYTVTDAKPVSLAGSEVSGWNQSLFQNIIFSGNTAGLSLNREQAPASDGKSVALKASDYTGTGNIQLIKDFYAGEEDYPVQLSFSVMPDGVGDVACGIKTSYYNESAAGSGATDGSGKNYLPSPITFTAGGTLMSFGKEVGGYAPGCWYNVSVVLNRVTIGEVTTKTAHVYINGEAVGDVYDWSAIASTLGNEGFYSVTLRENYSEAESVTSASYFDNLKISRLYNAQDVPNDRVFAAVLNSDTFTVKNTLGYIQTDTEGEAAVLTDSVIAPAGTVKSIVDKDGAEASSYTANGTYRLVLTNGAYVQSYVIDKKTKPLTITLFNGSGEQGDTLAEGSNTIKVENSPEDGVLIVAVYSGAMLANVFTDSISGGSGTVSFSVGAGESIKVMGWDSVAGMRPIFASKSF